MSTTVNPVILIRSLPNEDPEEKKAIENNLRMVESRLLIPRLSLVIGRYSVLPFYKELEDDIILLGGRLINTYQQHKYIANLMEWYEDLKDLTPKTWARLEDASGDGPFILKGETNSRKFQWDTHMFAANRREASEVAVELSNDSLITYQDIVVREYVPLKTYMLGLHGLPITKEFRFFVAYGQILSGGYYWSSYVEDLGFTPDVDEVPVDLLQEVIQKVGNKANFFAVDVAQTEKGDWIVIELNDGQMSGLSENNPNVLYYNLKRTLTNLGW